MAGLKSTENIPQEPWFAIQPGKTLHLLLQLSPMKTELPVGITSITNVGLNVCSTFINVQLTVPMKERRKASWGLFWTQFFEKRFSKKPTPAFPQP